MKCTSLKCALTEFWQFVCAKPSHRLWKTIITPESSLVVLLSEATWFNFFPPCDRLVLLILDFHISGLIEYTVLWKASFTQHSIFGISSLLYSSVVVPTCCCVVFLYEYSVDIHLLMDTWAACSFLLWIKLMNVIVECYWCCINAFPWFLE